MVLSMLFLTFGNVNVQFARKKLIWRTYTTKKALPTIRQVKLINQKEFAKVALDKNIEVFMIYISSLRLRIIIHLVKKASMALLLSEKVTILAEHSDFANMFLEESANLLLEQTKVNEHAIKLE